MPYSPRVTRLRYLYASLNRPGGVREAGGLRATINTLKQGGYRPGKTAWFRGVQRVGKDSYVTMIEPKNNSSFMIHQGDFDQHVVKKSIHNMRKQYRQAKLKRI